MRAHPITGNELIKFDGYNGATYVNPGRIVAIEPVRGQQHARTRLLFSGNKDDYLIIEEPIDKVLAKLGHVEEST